MNNSKNRVPSLGIETLSTAKKIRPRDVNGGSTRASIFGTLAHRASAPVIGRRSGKIHRSTDPAIYTLIPLIGACFEDVFGRIQIGIVFVGMTTRDNFRNFLFFRAGLSDGLRGVLRDGGSLLRVWICCDLHFARGTLKI